MPCNMGRVRRHCVRAETKSDRGLRFARGRRGTRLTVLFLAARAFA